MILATLQPAETAPILLYQADGRREIRRIIVANTYSGLFATAFSLYVSADGAEASTSNAIAYLVDIAANTTDIWDGGLLGSLVTLSERQALWCSADRVDAVTFTVEGY